MTRLRSTSGVLIALVALTLMMAGCDSTDSNDAEDPPAVVPSEAFKLDTDLFSDQTPGSTNAKAATGDYTNFTNAALRVWPVSLLIKANLIIPAAVTAAALQAEPELDEGTWVWASSTSGTNQSMTFRLEGTPDADNVLWSMKVTASNPERGQSLDNFELYTAQTARDGSAGEWSLFYKLEGERTHVLDADFSVTDDTTKEITFSVPETADEHAGDSVRYGVDGAQRTFEWTRVASSTVVTVTWNAETEAGSIVAPNYNDGVKACWDENLENVACPE